MQKRHDSQCLGPVKTPLLFGVGVFASALDQSGAKRGVAHIRLSQSSGKLGSGARLVKVKAMQTD